MEISTAQSEASVAARDVVNDAVVSIPTFDEPWAPLHNFEVWHTDPDGTYSWRNDAAGYSYEQ